MVSARCVWRPRPCCCGCCVSALVWCGSQLQRPSCSVPVPRPSCRVACVLGATPHTGRGNAVCCTTQHPCVCVCVLTGLFHVSVRCSREFHAGGSAQAKRPAGGLGAHPVFACCLWRGCGARVLLSCVACWHWHGVDMCRGRAVLLATASVTAPLRPHAHIREAAGGGVWAGGVVQGLCQGQATLVSVL